LRETAVADKWSICPRVLASRENKSDRFYISNEARLSCL
jgi:hypothetical protein